MELIVFDLDVTLLDTAPDLADALNAVLVENRREPRPDGEIRGVVSHGGMALIRLGFGIEPDDPDFEPLRQRLLDIYRANIANRTRPFPGMAELLDELERRGLNWGVVTNKPGWLTDPLLKQLAEAEYPVLYAGVAMLADQAHTLKYRCHSLHRSCCGEAPGYAQGAPICGH